MKYARKPMEVVAEAFDPSNLEQHARLGISRHVVGEHKHEVFLVSSAVTVAEVSPGDWIVEQSGLTTVWNGARFLKEFEVKE